MHTHKKFVSLLLCAAMILSMFATVPTTHATAGSNSTTGDIYSCDKDTDVYDDVGNEPTGDIYSCDKDTDVDDSVGGEPPDEPSTGDEIPDEPSAGGEGTDGPINIVPGDFPSFDIGFIQGPLGSSEFADKPAADEPSEDAPGMGEPGTMEEPGAGDQAPEVLGDGIYLCNSSGEYYRDSSGNIVSFASLHEAIHAIQAPLIVVHHITEIIKGTPNAYYITDRTGEKFYTDWRDVINTYWDVPTAVSMARENGYERVVLEGCDEEAIYIADLWGNVDTTVTYPTLDAAYAVVDAHEYDTIVLSGTVPYIRGSGLSNHFPCYCGYQGVKITKDLNIIAIPGGEATVIWDPDLGGESRSIWITGGVTVTVGGFTADGAGDLVIDGGAVWSGSYARWDEARESNYSGRRHQNALFYLESNNDRPGGGTLILGETATIQNYVRSDTGKGVIQVQTDNSVFDPDEPPVTIELYGKMINNAASMGGAIYLEGGTLNIYEGALLSGNSAETGGAICADGDEEDNLNWGTSMPSYVNMYGGIMEFNSAFTGGAVALWCSGYDINAVIEDVYIPPCTFTMYDGELRYNTAHNWMKSGDDLLFGYGGGGAVLLTARDAVFDMRGGSIIGNMTLPLSSGGNELEQAGHAILATGSLHGEQRVLISGGTIADNGDGNGTVVDVRQEQIAYKLLMILAFAVVGQTVLGNLDSVEDLPISTPVLDRIVEMMAQNGEESLTNYQMVTLFSTSPTCDLYDLIFDMIDYYGDSLFADSSVAQQQMETLANVIRLKEDGVGDPTKMLIVSGDPVLGEGQNLSISQDAYIGFDNPTPNFVPEIKLSEYAVPGAPVVEYGEDYYEDEAEVVDPQYILNVDDAPVIWDEKTDTLYVIDPDKVYSVTITVGSNSETAQNLTSYTLPTAEEMVSRGWIAAEMADYFYWYYEEHGIKLPCEPGAYFVLGRDRNFIGAVDKSLLITVDMNGGSLTLADGTVTVISQKLPAFTDIDPELVGSLYEGMDAPADPNDSGAKVIAAGLTTMRVDGIVDANCGLEDALGETLFHTIWFIPGVDPILAAVSPYCVEEETTLYVLWAYDENDNDIPDFLEVTLTMDPNGGLFGGDQVFHAVAAKGTDIPALYMESMMWGFYHDDVEDIPVLLVGAMGVPTDKVGVTYVPNRIYSILDREELAGLANVLYAGQIPGNYTYTVTEDETFFAIWSYDAPLGNGAGIPANPLEGADGVADVLEVIITFDPNGGVFWIDEDLTTASQLQIWWPYGMKVSTAELPYLREAFTHADVDGNPVYLLGFTKIDTNERVYSVFEEDKAAFSLLTGVVYTWNPTEGFVFAEDATYYAIWCTDMDGENTPDVFEALLTIYPNGGLQRGDSNEGSTEPFYTMGPIGSTIPVSDLETISDLLAHPDESIVLLGIATDPRAEEQIFSYTEKELFYDLEGLIQIGNITAPYQVNENVEFYAVWAYDKDRNGIADMFEGLVITLDANGGTINAEAAGVIMGYLNGGTIIDGSQFVYTIDPESSNPEEDGAVWMTYDIMVDFCGSLLIPPADLNLKAIAYDREGTQLIEGGSEGGFYIYDDLTIYAVWTTDATVTIHHNDGTSGTSRLEELPLGEEIDSGTVASVLAGLTHPEYTANRPVIAAGLTTEPVNGIVDEEGNIIDPATGDEVGTFSGEVYHSVAFVPGGMLAPEFAVINPYTVNGSADLYVVWAYDESEDGNGDIVHNAIPDFLEIQVELRINGVMGNYPDEPDRQTSGGQLFLPADDGSYLEYNYWTYIQVAKGSELSYQFLEYIMSGLSHKDIGTRQVLPVGIALAASSTDSSYRNDPYTSSLEDRIELATMENVFYKGRLTAADSMVVVEDTRFYVIWSYDENWNATPDVLEKATLIVDPNGGTIRDAYTDTYEQGGYLVFPWDEGSYTIPADQLSIVSMMLEHSPIGEHPVYLIGLSMTGSDVDVFTESEEHQRAFAELTDLVLLWNATEPFTITGVQKYQAIWGCDLNGDDIPDVLEATLTINPNGGLFMGDVASDSINYPTGAAIPADDIAGLLGNLSPAAETNWVLIGITTDEAAEGRCYSESDKSEFSLLNGVIYADNLPESYSVTGDVTFYALWGEDADENGIADVLESHPPVSGFTITWGALIFTYQNGIWEPENADAYWISVTNTAESPLTVSFSYEAEPGFEWIQGLFTLGAAAGKQVEFVATSIQAGETCQVSVWLSGDPGDLEPGQYVCGRCIVTIAATRSSVEYFDLGQIGATLQNGNGDGTPYYTIEAISDLPENVQIPGTINGIAVKEITKLYSGDGTDGRLNQTVRTVSLGEGVEVIRSKALAATPSLTTVYLPGTLTTIQGNAFSLNGQENGKEIAIVYNGTKEQWDAVEKASDWAKALDAGTTVTCTDGVYTMTAKNGRTWSWTANS